MKIEEFADKLQSLIGEWVNEDKDNRQVFMMICDDTRGLNMCSGGNGVMLATGLAVVAEEKPVFLTIMREVVKHLDKEQAD